jgi:putative membrane protein
LHALTVALLLSAAGLYAAGVAALWRKAGAGRGITSFNCLFFVTGLLITAAALLSPLHHAAERLLWAHMVQHELLMVVAAPLLAASRPLEAFAWALPAAWRGVMRLPALLGRPLLAWSVHAAALWAWHAPGLFRAAVASEWLHLAQHASFFASALLFWWSVMSWSRRPLVPILSVFTTMLHTGALGALMTFSSASWYAGYALEDQQLAGLVMWVPAGLAYPLAALAIVAHRLRGNGPIGAAVLADYAAQRGGPTPVNERPASSSG